VDVQSNWWEYFFNGVAVDMWRQAVPPDHTRLEADGLVQTLSVAPGAELLDVPCGPGRLSLELAARGFRMTGVDLSAESLAHARDADTDHHIDWQHRDMRDLPWPARFDGAFCCGNSFGYLDETGNAAFLRAVAETLKPGARFVLDTPMVLENLLPHLTDRPWFKAGDVYLLIANEYDHLRGRLQIEYTFVSNGRVETRYGSHQAWTYRQLVELIDRAGFDVATADAWSKEARSVMFVATRR
jgi:SAM-dependent methyltransferase